MTIKNAVPKFLALIFVSICVSFVMMSADSSLLAKIDSMSATDYIESQRKVYHHSFLHHYIEWMFIGCFYIASVEFVAYVIGFFFKKPAA